MSVHKATLRLFKAFPVFLSKSLPMGCLEETIAKRTIPRGYVFSPTVLTNYRLEKLEEIMSMIEASYGVTAESLNASFHKSWAKIADTSQEELMVEQIAHYVTTYGKQAPLEYMQEKETNFGVPDLPEKIITLPDFDPKKMWDEDYIYIPQEALEIPKLIVTEGIKLVIIKGYTKDELKLKLWELLQSGIALKEETVLDCVEVAKFVEFNDAEILGVKNKEVKIALYDQLEIVPLNPVEFLRYVVFKSTGETLLIKNKMLIEKIKESDNGVKGLFDKYAYDMTTPLDPYTSKEGGGLKRLAEIFYRFKPIFLAFKSEGGMNTVINKIRKLAEKHHKPMPEDYLNTVTAKIKKHNLADREQLNTELGKVNTFRKVRLAYALKYRTKDVDSILYKIRNGKGYATDFSITNQATTRHVLGIVLDSIIADVKKNVSGKRIYIPDYIHYALPATEKQFTGMFPSGTYVTVPSDMIFGINWKNVPGHTVDLDLSVVGVDGKIGWDRNYKSDSGDILFSGDIVNAQGVNGATELFYVRKNIKESLILYVNYYNFDAEYPVPFKIVVTGRQSEKREFKKNFMIDPNDLIAQSDSVATRKMKVLGLAVITPEECRFYFAEADVGNSITSGENKVAEQTRKYLFNFYEDSIDLKEVLEKAGANVVSEKFVDEKVGVKEFTVEPIIDIDLSPEALEKDTIIRLLT